MKLEIPIHVTDLSFDKASRSIRAKILLNKMFFGNAGRSVRNVLLINPPDIEAESFNFKTCKRGRYTNYEPYGLGVLATHLRRIGVKVTIVNLNSDVLRDCINAKDEIDFDFNESWSKSLHSAIESSSPDLIGVTCMFTQTHPILVKVCSAISEFADEIPIALGGVHITNAFANETTRNAVLTDLPAVSFFFKNECDIAFPTFIEVVNGKAEVEELTQITMRDGNEFIDYEEKSQPNVEILDYVPAHDLMNPIELSRWGKVGSYFYLKTENTRFATVLSNRGCRAQCTFCSVRNFNGVGVRRRSVRSVLDELKMLYFEHGVRHIMWLDDDFLYDTEESLALFNGMVRENIDLTWDCTNGVIAASCKPEIIDAAAASGCIGLSIGMESGNAEILRQIKKPGTIKNFLAAAEAIRRHPEIYTRVFLIIGFPGETFSQIGDTISVASEMGLDWYQIQVLQPLPNTPIFDRMVAEGLINPNDFANVKYLGGSVGKNAKASAEGRDMLTRDFKSIFSNNKGAAIPNPKELEDIWSYMVYHLNYSKLLNESRKSKQEQFLKNLEYISDVVAPGDAFALHYRIELMRQLNQPRLLTLKNRLDVLLAGDYYWRDRFTEFGLPVAR